MRSKLRSSEGRPDIRLVSGMLMMTAWMAHADGQTPVRAMVPATGLSSGHATPPISTTPTPTTTVEIDQKKADKVRVAYLFSFLRFVTWPDDRDGRNGDFHIVIVGNRRLGRMVEAVGKRKPFKDRRSGQTFPIRVTNLETVTQGSAATVADLVYIDGRTDQRDPGLKSVRDSSDSTFVIDDAIGIAAQGLSFATARFAVRNGAIKFDLNLQDAGRRGLALDAKLIQAADQIRSEGGP